MDVKPTNDLAEMSRKAGIPEALEGCHTSFIGNYVVDGHVPVKTIRKLLDEKPDIAGIPAGDAVRIARHVWGEDRALTIYAVSRDGTPPHAFSTSMRI